MRDARAREREGAEPDRGDAGKAVRIEGAGATEDPTVSVGDLSGGAHDGEQPEGLSSLIFEQATIPEEVGPQSLSSEQSVAKEETTELQNPVTKEVGMSSFDSPMTDGLGDTSPKNVADTESDVPVEMALNAGDLVQQKIFPEASTAKSGLRSEHTLKGSVEWQKEFSAGAVAEAGKYSFKGAVGPPKDLPVAEPAAANGVPDPVGAADARQAVSLLGFVADQTQQILRNGIKSKLNIHEIPLSGIAEPGFAVAGPTLRSTPSVPEVMQSFDTANERVMKVEELSSRFGEQVLSMVKQSEKVMRLTVQPAELGRLTVLVRETQSTMTLEIHSQNEAIRDLIARQEDSIRRLMQDHDVELGKFDVLLSEKGDDQRQRFAASDRGVEERFSGTGPALNENEELHESQQVQKNRAGSWVA